LRVANAKELKEDLAWQFSLKRYSSYYSTAFEFLPVHWRDFYPNIFAACKHLVAADENFSYTP
jgi:hypothetical protein